MAVEVKVYCRKKKTPKPKQIDHIPKCFQLPRSASASKPRTVFYLPICSFKEIELDPHNSKEIQSSVIVGCSNTSTDTIRGTTDPFSTRSNGPQDRRRKTLTNGIHLPLTDAKLFKKRANFQSCSNRKNENRDDALEHTPSRSQLLESRDACTTPGSVVWAKTDGEFWWPAEILGEGSNSAPSILVRHFGKQGSVRVDPAVDLSPFEECFEERRCNPANEFQNALKQALDYKEQQKPCKDLSGSPEGEKDNSSSSSRARSKRERKPKVHFDEVSRPLHTSRKVRRFKIMRSLGLAAPVGSPFNSSYMS
ncbi:putative PWWP domain-containing protein [Helianthus annuus]|nr:putative PWWP domain-containing protein [Helianthus annuus]